RNQNFSLRGNETLCHHLAVTTPSEGAVLPGDFLLNGVVLRTLMPTYMENISIPLGGNHACARPFVLKQGVRRDGGPMIDLLNIGQLDSIAFTEISNARNNANRRVCRCGGDLVNQHLVRVGVSVDDISKGPTDVHPDELHC